MADREQHYTEQVDGGVWIEKPGKMVNGRRYRRYVVRTHLVRGRERLDRTLLPYFHGRVMAGDIVVLGEKIVAIAEGRAVPLNSVRPGRLACLLSRHVRQLGYGLGLGRRETMEMAIREVGAGRILMAAAAGAVGRLVGRSGDFYRLAGRRVAAIDGPGPTTIPPFNRYIVLAPRRAEELAGMLARRLGVGVAIVDVNDVGSEVLATSPGVDADLVKELLRDNPMGQGSQRTPVGVLRPVHPDRRAAEWPRVSPVGLDGGIIVPNPGAGDGSLVWVPDAGGTPE